MIRIEDQRVQHVMARYLGDESMAWLMAEGSCDASHNYHNYHTGKYNASEYLTNSSIGYFEPSHQDGARVFWLSAVYVSQVVMKFGRSLLGDYTWIVISSNRATASTHHVS
jgi:hypothetical protein